MRTALRVTMAGAFALSIAAVIAPCAQAAVVSVSPNAPLTASGFTIMLGDGVAGFTFTSADTGYGLGAAVATTGTGQVTTFFGGVADFGSGSSIDQTGELYTFAAYPTGAGNGLIPFSATDDFIGLAFTQAGAVHYGYAEVNGAELVSYGYETAADTSILTGAMQAVPEPASLAFVVVGCLGLPVVRRWKRKV